MKTLLSLLAILPIHLWSQSMTGTFEDSDISTSLGVFDSACNGPLTTLEFTLPGGNQWEVTGVDIEYSMTAQGGGWKSHQRSQIHCQNSETAEPSEYQGTGDSGGIQAYDRNGVTIANGLYPANTTLVFEMRAWRTAQGSGCNATFNKVNNFTWIMTLHYQAVPDEGSVGIGTITPDSSAILELKSMQKGFLPPRMTATFRDAIIAPAEGLLVYCTDCSPAGMYTFNGTSWQHAAGSKMQDNDGDTRITVEQNVDEDKIRLTTAGAERMIITEDGKIGLGIGSPQYALHIKGHGERNVSIIDTSVTAGSKYGVHVEQGGASTGDRYGVFSLLNSSNHNDHTGTTNQLTGSGNGAHYGTRSILSGIGAGLQFGAHHLISTSGNNTHEGSRNELTGGGIGNHFGTKNLLSGSGTGIQYGSYNWISNTGGNIHFGTDNILSGAGGGIQYGTANEMLNSGNGQHIAVGNLLSGTGTGHHYAMQNTLTGTGAGEQYGIHTTISNSADSLHVGMRNLLSGSGIGRHFGTMQILSGSGTGNQYGSSNLITNSGGGNHEGTRNELSGGGGGARYGTRSILSGTGTGDQYGIHTTISNNGDSLHVGTRNLLSGSGTGRHIGSNHTLSGFGTGIQTGVKNEITNSGNNVHEGIQNDLSGGGSGNHYGVRNFIAGNGTGQQYGIFNEISNSGNNRHVGTQNNLTGAGSGNQYGTYNYLICTGGSGNQFGVYNKISFSEGGHKRGNLLEINGTGDGEIRGYEAVILSANATSVHGLSVTLISGQEDPLYGVYSSVDGGGTTYAGYFNGDVTVTGTFDNPSDQKLKTHITPLLNTTSLEKLKAVRIYQYLYDQESYPFMSLPETQQTGVIAQELQDVFPELVKKNIHPSNTPSIENDSRASTPEVEYLSVNYIGLIPHLISAVQELQKSIEILKEENQKQQTLIDALLKK